MAKFWLLVLFFFSNVLWAQSVEPYLFSLPKGSNLSILVQSVNTNAKAKAETLVEYNSDELKQPASTQKLITALAAELELGSDFRFITQFKTKAKIKNNRLMGDLIVELSGDPTFNRTELRKLLADLREKGINQITGNVLLNTSIFTSHDKASGWSWNNLTACYNAPPSATIIDGNCFFASIAPASKIGKNAVVTILSNSPVVMTGDVKTIRQNSKDLDDTYCELDVTHQGRNQYYLSGCIPYSKTKTYLKFAVVDSASYFSEILKNEMQKQNIAFSGKIVESNQKIANDLTVLATNQSAPLSKLLTVMLKDSNNLYADTIFRTLGAHYYNMPGTWRNSSDALKQILRQKAGIDLENAYIADGSGLSRLNLMNANKMMEILQYIAANDSKLNIIKKLPIAGVDGTLQYRRSFNHSPFKQNIYAKTGYIQGTYNLAGFIQTKEDNYIAFVQFLSGYSTDNDDKPKNNAIMQFESSFYKSFVKR